MAAAKTPLRIEVVYASEAKQVLLALDVAAGTTVAEAIAASGIRTHFPELDPARCPAGIFGRVVRPDTMLRDGDRVEIYRPLLADPKQSRRQRARRKA